MNESTICQMSYSSDKEGNFGLVFSDEIAEDESRAFSYWLPVPREVLIRAQLLESTLFREGIAIIFPCSYRNELIELKTQFGFPQFYFSHDLIGKQVAFQIEIDSYVYLFPRFRSASSLNLNRYRGGVSSMQKYDLVFLEVSPIDIDAMNDAYIERDFIFVGQTKSFGRRLESIVKFD